MPRPIDTAPKDGSLIMLHRKRGDKFIGSWREMPSPFRQGPQWVNTDDKFIDIPINPVIGWEAI